MNSHTSRGGLFPELTPQSVIYSDMQISRRMKAAAKSNLINDPILHILLIVILVALIV